MAKILMGTIVADMRGKQGGTVYSRNRYSNYSRNKTSPVNPNTTKQSAIRSAFGGLATMWRSLSLFDRDSFKALAQQMQKTNVFGNTFYYTGQNMFMSMNTTLLGMGLPIVTTAPVEPPVIPAIEWPVDNLVTVQVAADVWQINASFPTQPPESVLQVMTGYVAQIQATPIVGAALQEGSVKNLFRNVESIVGPAPIDNETLKGNWEANFGTGVTEPNAGMAIWFRIRIVTDSGISGPWATDRSIILPEAP